MLVNMKEMMAGMVKGGRGLIWLLGSFLTYLIVQLSHFNLSKLSLVFAGEVWYSGRRFVEGAYVSP